MGSALQNKSGVRISLTLPAELQEQIALKACALSASFDSTVAMLLKYGLQGQNERQAEISSLVQELIESGDDEFESHADALGEKIFNH